MSRSRHGPTASTASAAASPSCDRSWTRRRRASCAKSSWTRIRNTRIQPRSHSKNAGMQECRNAELQESSRPRNARAQGCRTDPCNPASLNHWKEPRVLLLSLRRERPLLAKRLVIFGMEERRLHAAVDDVPRKHGVAAAGTVDEEIGVHTGFRYGCAPVLAVSLGHLDRGGDPAIAERPQRLIVRMPLGLDVEAHVVDAGHQAPQPLDLSVGHG